MRELDGNYLQPTRDKLEVKAEQKKQTELKWIGSQLMHPGHRCFQRNLTTGEIQESKYIKQDIHWFQALDRDYSPKAKVIVEEGFEYTLALNKTNALKKFSK